MPGVLLGIHPCDVMALCLWWPWASRSHTACLVRPSSGWRSSWGWPPSWKEVLPLPQKSRLMLGCAARPGSTGETAPVPPLGELHVRGDIPVGAVCRGLQWASFPLGDDDVDRGGRCLLAEPTALTRHPAPTNEVPPQTGGHGCSWAALPPYSMAASISGPTRGLPLLSPGLCPPLCRPLSTGTVLSTADTNPGHQAAASPPSPRTGHAGVTRGMEAALGFQDRVLPRASTDAEFIDRL